MACRELDEEPIKSDEGDITEPWQPDLRAGLSIDDRRLSQFYGGIFGRCPIAPFSLTVIPRSENVRHHIALPHGDVIATVDFAARR